MNDPYSEPANILIADDSVSHLQLLADMLKEHGYKPRPVSNGTLALQAAQHNPPDLILLDINMPGMDGFEVCRHIKADPALKEIPVLFISGANELMDKVNAFKSGAEDYITKPFQFEEVAARIKTHLELSRKKEELQEHCNQLNRMEKLRDGLTHMIVHDLRAPVSVVMGYLEVLEKKLAGKLDETEQKCLSASIANTNRLVEMVTSLLDISRMESGQMPLHRQACSISKLAMTAVDTFRPMLEAKKITVMSQPDTVKALGDEDVIRRILTNLIDNGIKHTASASELHVNISQHDGFARVEVTDNGPGIPAEYHTKIFEKFGQVGTGRPRYSTGLGLAFCKLAVETHGGQIGVKSTVGSGSTFWFTLPVAAIA